MSKPPRFFPGIRGRANRLKTYTEDAQLKGTYYYNALGQRVRTDKAEDNLLHYDLSGQYLGETSIAANGTDLQSQIDYVYLDNMPVAQIETQYGEEGQAQSRTLTYLHADHLNTPRIGTNSSETIVWRWDSDAFGQSAPNTDPENDTIQTVVNLRFPGQIKGGEASRYYNYFRDYDPSTGRYLTSDPIGQAGGINTYAYVEGNPIKAIDSLGLKTCLLTTVGPAGIRDHAAVYTSRGDDGGPALSDPAGSYGAANGGGSSGLVIGSSANIQKFKDFHKEQTVETACVDTSQKEEENIINKAAELPSAAPFQCSITSSTALSGQPSFPHVEAGTFWPGNLLRQVRKGQ